MSEDRALSQPCDMLIGMDVAIRELLELVNLEEFGVNDKVISIVGCPGLGKTTLAKAFSDLEMIRERFNPPVWVSASECRSAQDLLIKVIRQAQASHVHPAQMISATPNIDLLQTILAQERYSLHTTTRAYYLYIHPAWVYFSLSVTHTNCL